MDVLYLVSNIVFEYELCNTFSIYRGNKKTKESSTRSWITQLSSVHGQKDNIVFGALTRAITFLLI